MTLAPTTIGCPICHKPLRFSVATSRRSKRKKLFVMLVCPSDGRHFRGFISDQGFVRRLVDQTGNGLPKTGTGTEGG